MGLVNLKTRINYKITKILDKNLVKTFTKYK